MYFWLQNCHRHAAMQFCQLKRAAVMSKQKVMFLPCWWNFQEYPNHKIDFSGSQQLRIFIKLSEPKSVQMSVGTNSIYWLIWARDVSPASIRQSPTKQALSSVCSHKWEKIFSFRCVPVTMAILPRINCLPSSQSWQIYFIQNSKYLT